MRLRPVSAHQPRLSRARSWRARRRLPATRHEHERQRGPHAAGDACGHAASSSRARVGVRRRLARGLPPLAHVLWNPPRRGDPAALPGCRLAGGLAESLHSGRTRPGEGRPRAAEGRAHAAAMGPFCLLPCRLRPSSDLLRRSRDAGGRNLRCQLPRSDFIGEFVLQRGRNRRAHTRVRKRFDGPEIHAEARRLEQRFETAR